MAESLTIARPYAEALFRSAQEEGALPLWSERLELLAGVMQNPELRDLIAQAGFGRSQLAELLCQAAQAKAGDTLANFIALLAENNRFACLPEIALLFEKLRQGVEGVREAEIHSPFPLSAAQMQQLIPQLEAHFETRLRPHVVIAPELIGGVKAVVGDRVLDLSIRAKLDAMATALNH